MNADLHVAQVPATSVVLNDIGFDDRSFRPPLYYGLRGGYLLKPTVGFEAEFIHVKAFARLPPAIAIQQYNVFTKSCGASIYAFAPLSASLFLIRKSVHLVKRSSNTSYTAWQCSLRPG